MKLHRIRNLDLALLLPLLVLNRNTMSISLTLTYVIVAFIGCVLLKIGGGDFKLFALLVLTQGALISTSTYFIDFFYITVALLIFTVIENRRWGGSIPLAPAILLPFLLSYLEI